jgi:hypothetical protein
LGEVPITLRCLVDDVHGSAVDHVQRGLALAMLEHDLAACKRLMGADLAQVFDLRRREPREERRIVGV